MESSLKLERLSTSCSSCPSFNPTSWCSSGRRSGAGLRRSITGVRSSGEFDYQFDVHSTQLDESRWHALWKKFKREICPSSGSIRVPYDPYTYAQNFDQGLTWMEPDNLSRSFSARFAYPNSARILHELC